MIAGKSKLTRGRGRASAYARTRVSGTPTARTPRYVLGRSVRALERPNGGAVLPGYHPAPETRSTGLTARSRTTRPGGVDPPGPPGPAPGVSSGGAHAREPLLRAYVTHAHYPPVTCASPARHVRYLRRAACAAAHPRVYAPVQVRGQVRGQVHARVTCARARRFGKFREVSKLPGPPPRSHGHVTVLC